MWHLVIILWLTWFSLGQGQRKLDKIARVRPAGARRITRRIRERRRSHYES